MCQIVPVKKINTVNLKGLGCEILVYPVSTVIGLKIELFVLFRLKYVTFNYFDLKNKSFQW